MKLVKSDDPILKTPADNWVFGLDLNSEQVANDLINTMKENNGMGLAANQVGLSKRVFAIKLTTFPEPVVMFNPRIISASDETATAEEGCLSFPNLWLDVKRPKSIVSEYFDKSGKECKIELNNIDARCFQHELDHLDGICFTDKVSTLKLAMAKKKQQKQRKHNG